MTRLNMNTLVKNNQAKFLKEFVIDDITQASDYIGDFNGDGIDDFVLSAPFVNNISPAFSISYIIYGNTNNIINLENFTNKIGLIITSEPFEYTFQEDDQEYYDGQGITFKTGHVCSRAGDFNNDGYADLIVSVPYYDDNKGRVYIVYGGLYNTSNFSLGNMTSENGLIIYGSKKMYSSQLSYTIGDYNNDGFSDVIVHEKAPSTVTLIYGNISYNGAINLNNLNEYSGFKILTTNSSYTSFSSGRIVDNIGDVNGDGYPEIAIAEDNWDTETSKLFIIYGSARYTNIELSHFNTTTGYNITGFETEIRIAGLGDVNGDNIPDILVGSHNSSPFARGDAAGKAFVIFGNNTIFEGFDINYIGNRGFTIIGSAQYDEIGESVCSVIDVNNDGLNDIFIGSSNEHDGAYIIFGSSNISDVDLKIESDRFISIGNNPEAEVRSLSSAGDFNRDGYDDFVISYIYEIYENNNYKLVSSHYLVFDLYNSSSIPMEAHSVIPSVNPTTLPTANPSIEPSFQSTVLPTPKPSFSPTAKPTFKPSFKPTLKPTYTPSTKMPTFKPSLKPTSATPTQKPSSHIPTIAPTFDRDNLPPYVINLSNKDLSNVESNDLVYSPIEIGDFNKDGLKDYFFYGQAGNNAEPVVTVGKIVFSKSTSFLDSLKNDINSENLIKLTYSSISNFYPAVSDIGDYNLDGFSDIAFCVYSIRTCYIIYGTSLLEDVYLPDLDSSKGFKISDTSQTYRTGYFSIFGGALAGGFDFDGDGKSDFAITDYSYNNFQGRVYVILGKANLRTNIDLNLSPEQEGIIIFSGFVYNYVYNGYNGYIEVQAGASVIFLGDYNGDGYDDMGISSLASIYIIYGSSDANGFSLDAIPSDRGFTYTGNYGDTTLPSPRVKSIGDFNGDGFQDIAICYGIYRAEGWSVETIGVTTKIILGNSLNNNNPSFEIPNACSSMPGMQIGSALKVGDVNGDGYDDFFISKTKLLSIGSTKYFFPSGYYYLIFGKFSVVNDINLNNFDSSQGVAFLDDNTYNVIDYGTSFKSLSNAVSAGDLNKDGYADFLLSSVSRAYLIYGRSNFIKMKELIPSVEPTTVNTDIPTTVPTMKPTFMPTQAIEITTGGVYNGTSSSENFIIDSSDDITISGGGGKDMYTLKPNANTITTITDFNKSEDKINLQAFDIHRFNEVNITAGSIFINLEDNQKMRLLDLTPGDINANNFIFSDILTSSPTTAPTEEYIAEDSAEELSHGAIAGIIIGGTVAIIFLGCICARLFHLWPFASASIGVISENKYPSAELHDTGDKGLELAGESGVDL